MTNIIKKGTLRKQRVIISLIVGILFVSASVLMVRADSVEKMFNKTFSPLDDKAYALYFENAAYSLKCKKMFIVTSYRNRSNAYIYACDAQGQSKAYLTLNYEDGALGAALKITYDGPLIETEANDFVATIGDGVLSEMETFSQRDTVRVLNAVSLRSEPVEKAERVALLKRGDILELVTEDKKWILVKSPADATIEGWVPRGYVKKR